MRLMALLLFLTGVSLAVEVVLGFGKLTPDEDIIRLLERCNAKVRAMWYASPYGGGGSGAEREWHEPREFFAKLRNDFINMYKTTYFERVIGFKIILENNLLKVDDLTKYSKLLKFIRGLVNIYYEYREGYFYIKNRGPIVYAVLAKTDNVSCLEDSKLVKDISVSSFPFFTVFLKYVPYYFKPKIYSKYYFFPEVKNAKPEELYRMMVKAVKELENNKEFIQYYEKFYVKGNFYQTMLKSLKSSIESAKRRSIIKDSKQETPIPTYYPNEGDIFYTGTNVVRYYKIQWNNPGDWSVERPGYEHDLVAKNDYFTGCRSSSDLPDWYDDCPTACVSEMSGDYCAFSFGTYNALLIEPEYPYTGVVQFTRGPAGYTDFRLNAQEVFHSPICFKFLNRWICLPCPFDTPWCMGGSPYRDGNPDLNCPTNSLTLKTCAFRRFYPYSSTWEDKYDCTHASWCD